LALTGLLFYGFKKSKSHKNKGIITMKQKYLIINDKEKNTITKP